MIPDMSYNLLESFNQIFEDKGLTNPNHILFEETAVAEKPAVDEETAAGETNAPDTPPAVKSSDNENTKQSKDDAILISKALKGVFHQNKENANAMARYIFGRESSFEATVKQFGKTYTVKCSTDIPDRKYATIDEDSGEILVNMKVVMMSCFPASKRKNLRLNNKGEIEDATEPFGGEFVKALIKAIDKIENYVKNDKSNPTDEEIAAKKAQAAQKRKETLAKKADQKKEEQNPTDDKAKSTPADPTQEENPDNQENGTEDPSASNTQDKTTDPNADGTNQGDATGNQEPGKESDDLPPSNDKPSEPDTKEQPSNDEPPSNDQQDQGEDDGSVDDDIPEDEADPDEIIAKMNSEYDRKYSPRVADALEQNPNIDEDEKNRWIKGYTDKLSEPYGDDVNDDIRSAVETHINSDIKRKLREIKGSQPQDTNNGGGDDGSDPWLDGEPDKEKTQKKDGNGDGNGDGDGDGDGEKEKNQTIKDKVAYSKKHPFKALGHYINRQVDTMDNWRNNNLGGVFW